MITKLSLPFGRQCSHRLPGFSLGWRRRMRLSTDLNCLLILAILALLLSSCSPSALSTPAISATPPAPTDTPTLSASPTPSPLPSFTPVPTPLVGRLFVDPQAARGAISPLVFGSNYGPWIFVNLEMRPQAIAAGITYLRFPGGNWGDQNDLDEWQIDQYLALCRELGAEPAISVRLRGGTASQAAELVRLVNIQKGANVRYWSIGNEPSLYPDYDTQRYNQEWREFALAMRQVDPQILLVGPDIHQISSDPARNPKDAAGRDWLEEFLRANGDLVDIVAVHRYPFPTTRNGPAPRLADLRNNSPEWDQILPSLRAIVRQTAGRDLPLAITEVNSSWAVNSGGEATMDSHYNAIWWADVLTRMIRNGVQIVAQFALVGEYGLMGKYKVLPIYYVYPMLHQVGSELVYTSSDHNDLSILAARRSDHRLGILVINRSTEAVSYPLQIAGLKEPLTAEVWLFDPDHAAVPVENQTLDSETPLTFPAQSLTLYLVSIP